MSFLLLQVVDRLDVLIGQLLNFVEALLLVVLRQAVVLQHLFQAVVGVAPHLAHAVAAVLAQLVHVLRQLLAALLGQRGQRDAHHLAVVGRIEAEARGTDGLLDRAQLRRVERLRHDERRLGNREARDLVERHLGSVGLDVHAVQNRHRCAPGPHARKLVLQVIDRRLHPLADFAVQPFQVSDIHRCLIESPDRGSSHSSKRSPASRSARRTSLA